MRNKEESPSNLPTTSGGKSGKKAANTSVAEIAKDNSACTESLTRAPTLSGTSILERLNGTVQDQPPRISMELRIPTSLQDATKIFSAESLDLTSHSSATLVAQQG